MIKIKIKRKKVFKIRYLIAIFAMLVLLLTYGWLVVSKTNNQVDTGTSQKETNSPSLDDTKTADSDKKDAPKTTDEIPVSNILSASIKNIKQSEGYITFNGGSNDTQGGGQCSLTLTNSNDRPITKTSATNIIDGTASCTTIQISENEFSYLGNWLATFRYYNNDTQAIATESITIK